MNPQTFGRKRVKHVFEPSGPSDQSSSWFSSMEQLEVLFKFIINFKTLSSFVESGKAARQPVTQHALMKSMVQAK